MSGTAIVHIHREIHVRLDPEGPTSNPKRFPQRWPMLWSRFARLERAGGISFALWGVELLLREFRV